MIRSSAWDLEPKKGGWGVGWIVFFYLEHLIVLSYIFFLFKVSLHKFNCFDLGCNWVIYTILFFIIWINVDWNLCFLLKLSSRFKLNKENNIILIVDQIFRLGSGIKMRRLNSFKNVFWSNHTLSFEAADTRFHLISSQRGAYRLLCCKHTSFLSTVLKLQLLNCLTSDIMCERCQRQERINR